MSAELFLDTNLFIYELDNSDPRKTAIASDIIGKTITEESGCISFQVIQECLSSCIRKAEIALSPTEMRQYMRNVMLPLFKVPATTPLYERSLSVLDRYGFAFYDSLIVAAALEAGCSTLYTEDLQHGQQIEQLRIVNPFLES